MLDDFEPRKKTVCAGKQLHADLFEKNIYEMSLFDMYLHGWIFNYFGNKIVIAAT